MTARKKILSEILVVTMLSGIVTFFVFTSSAKPLTLHSGQRMLMGTLGKIVVVTDDMETGRDAIKAAFEQLNRLEKMMSSYIEDSQVAKINSQAYDQKVKVTDEVFEVLRESAAVSELSGGAFDITIGPAKDLWQRAQDTNQMPGSDALTDARSKVGYKKLILDTDRHTVRFAVLGMKIDLGGIAKGYAIDKAIDAIKAKGIKGAMVDIGGDIACFGTAPDGKKNWHIGLQNPDSTPENAQPQLLLKLEVSQAAVATSGDYQRFVEVAGRRLSHIIDTGTGFGSGELKSVTIICGTAMRADALATAVTVLGPQKGLRLIETLDGVEGILIPKEPNCKIIKTSGADTYISKDRHINK